MPLPTKAQLDEKYGVGNAPILTRVDVERQRAERERWWAKMDEKENKAKEEARNRAKDRENRTLGNVTGGALPQVQTLEDNSRPGQPGPSVYGLLKSAKKRKRDPDSNDDPQPTRTKSSASASPAHGGDGVTEGATLSSYAPAKKGPRKNDATYSTIIPVDTRRLANTAWYNKIDTRKAKYSRTDLVSLQRVVDIVVKYIKATKGRDEEKRERLEKELRQVVQQVEFFKFLSPILIKKSKVLEDQGLPAIFDNHEGIEFVYDIRADALYLYNRWITGDIDGHLLRGIKTEKAVLQSGKRRTAHRLDPNYEKKSANYIGNNTLVNGQWWPIRLCLLRDGAHGEVEAGISGQTGKGAYSIVVSGGGYADDDQGDVIRYCGTESDSPTPTKNTNLMLEAEIKNNPIRVFRSEKKDSRYAPKKGIRYDGLYVITDREVLNEATGMYRFRLERCPGQDPLRYKGVEARPNGYDLAEAASIKELLAGMA